MVHAGSGMYGTVERGLRSDAFAGGVLGRHSAPFWNRVVLVCGCKAERDGCVLAAWFNDGVRRVSARCLGVLSHADGRNVVKQHGTHTNQINNF